MRPDPELWFPPHGQGFPLLPGGEEELEKTENGDVSGGRTGVSLSEPLRTPTQSPPKKIIKEKNTHKNSKTENPQKDNIVTVKDKKRNYRGKGKKRKKENVFSIMLTNLRGYRSKDTSLKKIIKEKIPSMIVMNETLLAGNMKVSIPSYYSWSRNRTEKGGGGIATSVANQYKECSVGAGQGEDEEEYLITRIECFSPALNVINCYGEQRSTKKEEVERKWERLRKEMENIRTRKEYCILAGDQNKHVGRGPMGVPGNNPDISVGGRLIRDLLSTGNWFLVNGLGQEIVQGGPWTRKDPATGVESCLDLFIVSRELLPYVDNLLIDSKQ